MLMWMAVHRLASQRVRSHSSPHPCERNCYDQRCDRDRHCDSNRNRVARQWCGSSWLGAGCRGWHRGHSLPWHASSPLSHAARHLSSPSSLSSYLPSLASSVVVDSSSVSVLPIMFVRLCVPLPNSPRSIRRPSHQASRRSRRRRVGGGGGGGVPTKPRTKKGDRLGSNE